jgi:uridine kinase
VVSSFPPDDIADLVVRRTLERPPTLDRTRLVCIDGPAGAGKSTLGAAVTRAAEGHGSALLLHMDDLYEGWGGLADVFPRVRAGIVDPLRAGRPGRYRRYEWHAGRFAEAHDVEPVDVLVLEGVGSGATAWADSITTLVWVEAPEELRLARGIERDGEEQLPHWLAWMADEAAVHARDRTRERADLLVDGTGIAAPVVAQTGGRTSP